MGYFINNVKLRSYFSEQEKSFEKEKMMLSIKAKCETWKRLFQDEADAAAEAT